MVSLAVKRETLRVIHKKPLDIPVIGITGGKGGVGKSTLAVNVAEALLELGKTVSLADADVDAPDDHLLLGIRLSNRREVAITRPVINQDRCTRCRKCVSACRINALFQPRGGYPLLIGECNGCEACILACPADAIDRGKRPVGWTYRSERGRLTLFTGKLTPGVEESSLVVTALMDRVWRDVGGSDVILVDTSPGIHCNVMHALKGSDAAFAVTEPTPLGIHDLKLMLKLLDILHIRARVILNRSNLPGVKGQVTTVARLHNAGVSSIPDDKALFRSYVEGVPAVRAYPEAAGSRKIISIAHEIAKKYLK